MQSVSVRFDQPLRAFAITSLASLCLFLVSMRAVADPVNVIFTIDPTQSPFSNSAVDNTNGAYSAQSPGSASSPVSGNFVLSFDPTTDNPSSIQFVGGNPNNNNSYWQPATNVASANPFGTPAQVALTTAGGQDQYAIRNLTWSYNSPVINQSGQSGLTETFTATTTNFLVTSGGIDYQTPAGTGSSSYVGATDHLTGGTWTLSESAPGSGNWTLTGNAYYTYGYNNGTTTGTITASGIFVANASFSSSNLATVPTPSGSPQTVTVPGSNPNAAVTATLPANSSGGTLTVQQVPGITSLTQAAVTAGENNPVFALSTSDTSIGAPQIWQVDYSGSLNGGAATLTFDFNPTLIPSGTPLSDLGIWHFNQSLDQWQFLTGPIVDSYATLGYDTITVETSSFSPFFLGDGQFVTPEPSTAVLAVAGLISLAGVFNYRRRRAACVLTAQGRE